MDEAPFNSSGFIGWEAPALNNTGTNYFFKINHRMRIRGIQIDVSFSVLTEIHGFAEVFSVGVLLDSKPNIPSANNKQGFFVIPGADGGFSDGNDVPFANNFHGGDVGKGGLFALILKEWMPRGANKTVYVPLNLEAKPGNWIIMHADHMGAGPVDFELQSVLVYDLLD